MKRPAPISDIDATVMRRLDALERLIDAEYQGKASTFQEKTGIKMSQVGQWFTGYRALRDKALRRLEEKTNKPEGWFDTSHGNAAITSPRPTVNGSGTVARMDQRRSPSPDEVIDHLIVIVEGLDETAREGLASALPCLVRKPGDLRAVAAAKAWLLTPAESAQRKQAKA